ncbi:MAG: hypothetical protein IKB65_04295 [Ruminiclostridium sp.]|nr:hypothetical protein [Ruminiclostridium sp.]
MPLFDNAVHHPPAPLLIKRGVALHACKPLIYKDFLSVLLKEIYKKESPEREEVHPGSQRYIGFNEGKRKRTSNG